MGIRIPGISIFHSRERTTLLVQSMQTRNVAFMLNVLNPDDKLMERFQKTLHTHLSDVDNRLAEEILELEAQIKQSEKELETENLYIYKAQQDAERQETTIKHHLDTLTKVAAMRENKDRSIEDAKEILKKSRAKFKEEESEKKKLSKELNNLTTFYSCLSKWEKDLDDYLTISKRMSFQDANKKKVLMNKKQQRDFILYRLREEVWKMETEIVYLDEQLQIKDKEKEDANQNIIDASADLETLHTEYKLVYERWKAVIAHISKKICIHDSLNIELEQSRNLCNMLSSETQRTKKETEKEMEINANLTTAIFRTEIDISLVSRTVFNHNKKITIREMQLQNITKISDQTQHDYNAVFVEYQNCQAEAERIHKKYAVIFAEKNKLEELIFHKLDEKIVSDKTARHVNELLMKAKSAVLEHEISVARAENMFGNNLLDLERFKNTFEDHKLEYQEYLNKGVEKEKQIDELQKGMLKHENTIEKRQRKLLEINNAIEQIISTTGSDELSPLDLKIIALQKDIQELVQENQKAQHFWMRQQGFMVSMSKQREARLRELNLFDKETMIMAQKNYKLEYAMEVLAKEEANTNKVIASLEQKLSRTSADLVMQKDLKDEWEDKNCEMKNECVLSFQELELEMIKLKTGLKNLSNEKIMLKEELKSIIQESLSWEKKVQLMQETVKNIKEDRSAGDIASMKSEIHRMETRLSYLKKIQEKLVHDMELCVARRSLIVDSVISKLKKNPKERHNLKVVMHKRISNQRAKIKKFLKITKEVGNTLKDLKSETQDVQNQLTKCQQDVQSLKKQISSVDNDIKQLEMLKCHNLHSLVQKQRKVKRLHAIKSGSYKMIYKNESLMEENLQTERIQQEYLKDVMEKTVHDFPMLRGNVRKILLTLKIV